MVEGAVCLEGVCVLVAVAPTAVVGYDPAPTGADDPSAAVVLGPASTSADDPGFEEVTADTVKWVLKTPPTRCR